MSRVDILQPGEVGYKGQEVTYREMVGWPRVGDGLGCPL